MPDRTVPTDIVSIGSKDALTDILREGAQQMLLHVPRLAANALEDQRRSNLAANPPGVGCAASPAAAARRVRASPIVSCHHSRRNVSESNAVRSYARRLASRNRNPATIAAISIYGMKYPTGSDTSRP